MATTTNLDPHERIAILNRIRELQTQWEALENQPMSRVVQSAAWERLLAELAELHAKVSWSADCTVYEVGTNHRRMHDLPARSPDGTRIAVENELFRLRATEIRVSALDSDIEAKTGVIRLKLNSRSCAVEAQGFIKMLGHLNDAVGAHAVMKEVRKAASLGERWATV